MHNLRLNLLQWKIPGDASFEFAAICCNVELTNELQAVGFVTQDPSFTAASAQYEYPLLSAPAWNTNA